VPPHRFAHNLDLFFVPGKNRKFAFHPRKLWDPMQTFLRRFSVIAGFALLVLLLIGNSLITKRQLDVQVGNQVWVLHTRQVLYELEKIEYLLVDAETGQRGYLLTGDPSYLEPYNRAIVQVDSHIASLDRLTTGNPPEQANAARLDSAAHLKLNELTETIALYRGGNTKQAMALVLTGRGKRTMDNIRAIVAAMQSEETDVYAIRLADYQRSVRITSACLVLATIVAIVGLIVLAWFILRERALRDRHTQEIRDREEWFRVTLTSIGDAVIATDREGIVTFFNPVAEALTGIRSADAVGKTVTAIFPIFNEFSGQPAENPVTKVMSLGTIVGLANHTALRHADGHLIPIEDSAAPIRDDRQQLIGVVLVFHDVSAERKSQEIVRKTEKLAAAARLSATVAHEINNPLAAVVNLIFIAKTDPGTPPSVVQQLTLAEQEIERVAHITRQTLGFYRESNAPEPTQLDALINSVLKMYSNKLGSSGIRVQRSFSECPPVLAVAGELKQAFSNILANAIDAAGPDGSIVIDAHCLPANSKGAVEVIVADSGAGIAPDTVERVFEPFFTTKKDVGTGLGLWVTKEIIERHGGTITIRPANGYEGFKGAAFVLHLPFATPQPAPEAPSSGNANSAV
jgi:PAS domain S-box-containing protein